MDKLVFSESPAINIATNTFIRVPTILQFEDTPLIEVIKLQRAGYTTQIPIYHPDGTYLAKVVGSRLFATPEGKKAGLSLEYPHRKTVCKLGKRILFEITREEAAALKTQAELYTPDGFFVRCTESPQPELYTASGDALQVRGVTMIGSVFSGCRIGIWIRKDGSIGICVS
jgi:hypothetical protein